jgi:hypothetical protein
MINTIPIPTLSTGSFVAESAYPNYYPAIVVPKALAIGPKLKQPLQSVQKGVPIGFGTDLRIFPHGDNAKSLSI